MGKLDQHILDSIARMIGEFNENCRFEEHVDTGCVYELLGELYFLASGKKLDDNWFYGR